MGKEKVEGSHTPDYSAHMCSAELALLASGTDTSHLLVRVLIGDHTPHSPAGNCLLSNDSHS